MQFENRRGQAQQVQQGGFFQEADPRLAQVDESAVNAYVVKVFGWMFFGLLVTTLSTVAIVVAMSNPANAQLVSSLLQFPGILVIFVAQIGLVWVISARVMTMNPGTAKLLYVIYASLNGLTVGVIAIMISVQAVGSLHMLGTAFGLTAASFGAMALYGYFTGRDLTSFSSLLRMALIGLILVMVVNIFLGSDTMSFAISIVGLLIFLGLVAADTNKIKNHFARVALGSTNESRAAMGINIDQQALASNLAIVGALMLYLDFINIFLFILRILSRR